MNRTVWISDFVPLKPRAGVRSQVSFPLFLFLPLCVSLHSFSAASLSSAAAVTRRGENMERTKGTRDDSPCSLQVCAIGWQLQTGLSADGFDQLCRSSIVANEGMWAQRGSAPVSFCTAVCGSANPLAFMTADCFPRFTFRTAGLPQANLLTNVV